MAQSKLGGGGKRPSRRVKRPRSAPKSTGSSRLSDHVTVGGGGGGLTSQPVAYVSGWGGNAGAGHSTDLFFAGGGGCFLQSVGCSRAAEGRLTRGEKKLGIPIGGGPTSLSSRHLRERCHPGNDHRQLGVPASRRPGFHGLRNGKGVCRKPGSPLECGIKKGAIPDFRVVKKKGL